MSQRAVIFINGDLSNLSGLKLAKNDLLIGVDGGAKRLAKPDLIIGDLDSLQQVPENIPVIKYPQDKDFTDTELALKYCQKQKIKAVIIVGFLGRRLDHMMANIMNLVKYDLKITIIEGNQELFLVKDRVQITGKQGDLISLIPLLGDCRGVNTFGLKWRLQGENLKVGESRGVSNVMLGKKAKVSLKQGCLLVVKVKTN